MKRNVSIIMLVIILLSLIPINISPIASADGPEGGIIDGDSIYWENSWGKLEVYPHTGYGSTYIKQWCNATWKLAANDLDIAFRFNDSLVNAHIYELVGSEWIDRTGDFQHTTYNDKHYYYVTNVHFEQDETRRFRWEYSVKMNTTGKWDFMAKLSSESIQYALENDRYVMLDPWWDTNWNFFRVCSINYNLVDVDLLNFPVLVRIPSTVTSKCQANGEDIRFIATAMTGVDNETELFYDIEDWNSTGESLVWVNVTNVQSDIDTTFLMYYGNSGATNNESPHTWNGNYAIVMHLNDTHDSTINYNNGSISGTDVNITGRVGFGKDFNNFEIIVPTSDSINLTYNFTIEAWVSFTDISSDTYFLTKFAGPIFNYELVYSTANEFIRFQTSGDNSDTASNSIASTVPWYYYVATRERGEDLRSYINSTRSGTIGAETDGYILADAPLYVGGRGGTNSNTYLDEIRISNILRNTSWLNATYNSIVTPLFFCAIGVEVASPVVLYVNTTTNITRTNATLNGYSPNVWGVPEVQTGFWYGTTNPPTDADTNITYGIINYPPGSDGRHFESATGSVLTENTTYYVKSWIDTGPTFVESSNVECFSTLENPLPPTDVQTNIEPSNSSLNISWNNGDNADKTVIIRNVGSYPIDVTDGIEVYNSTSRYFWEEDLTGNYFFTMWSWNDTFNVFSVDSVNVEYGALILHCYNESNPTENITYDIQIKNADGSQVYTAEGIGDGHIVNVDDIPFGEDTQILVNSSLYFPRIYYFDLLQSNVYNLSFYLPHRNFSELYLLTVEDRSGQPIQDATVQIQRFINTTGIYENVSITLTDGSGQTDVYLIPGVPYQIILTHDNYSTRIEDYIPSPDIFLKTFVMVLIQDAQNVTKFLDTIIFTGEWILSNNTLHIYYFDKENNTIDTAFQIWEQFNFVESLNATYEFTTENDFHIYVSGLNLNRTHRIELNLNHSTIGRIINQSIYVFPAFKPNATIRNLNWLEQLFVDQYGEFELGYVNTFIIFLPSIIILIVLAKHPGIGTIGSASYITFISAYIEITLELLGVASLLFTIGIIIIIVKRGKKVTT